MTAATLLLLHLDLSQGCPIIVRRDITQQCGGKAQTASRGELDSGLLFCKLFHISIIDVVQKEPLVVHQVKISM